MIEHGTILGLLWYLYGNNRRLEDIVSNPKVKIHFCSTCVICFHLTKKVSFLAVFIHSPYQMGL